jgi:hypothetical protein
MGYEFKHLRPLTGIVTVYFSEIRMKKINTLPGQKVEYFGVENLVVRNVTTGLHKD